MLLTLISQSGKEVGHKLNPIIPEGRSLIFIPHSDNVPVNIAVIGGGIAGSSVALLLRERGHRVTLVDQGIPRVNKVLINSNLLKGSDIELSVTSVELYRRWGVRILEYPSLTIGEIPQDLVESWRKIARVVEEKYVDWLGVRALESWGTDRLVFLRDLFDRARAMKGRAELLEDGIVRVVGERVKFDVVVLASGAWNGEMMRLPLKSYYCWASTVLTQRREVGSYMVYDYEYGFYSRPLAGRGLPLALVGDGETLETKVGRVPCYSTEGVLTRVRSRFGKVVQLHVGGNYCESSPDMGPVAGEVRDKVFVIGGLNGYGAEVGPGLAKLLVDEIEGVGKVYPEYSLHRFRRETWGKDFPLGRERHEI